MTPFTKQGGGINWIRIVEFLVGAIVIAAATSAANLAVMGEKVESIKTSVQEIKQSVKNQDERIRTVEIKIAVQEARRD